MNFNYEQHKKHLISSHNRSNTGYSPSLIPMQSYADRDNDNHKKNDDFKSKIIASSESDEKRASQHQDQDNLCYRGDDCQQANQGQQIVGKDNEAKGFNDQSDNVPLSALGAGTGTGNGTTPTPTPTPTTGTFSVCKVVINKSGLVVNPSNFTFTFTSEGADPAEFPGSADCTKVTVPEGQYNFKEAITIPQPERVNVLTSVTGDCTQDSLFGKAFHGSIKAGETQTCTVTNQVEDEG